MQNTLIINSEWFNLHCKFLSAVFCVLSYK
jgi:hypothetical protein